MVNPLHGKMVDEPHGLGVESPIRKLAQVDHGLALERILWVVQISIQIHPTIEHAGICVRLAQRRYSYLPVQFFFLNH